MTFGEHFKAMREAAGLTQEQLAEAANISVNLIRNYEEKDTLPRINLCYKLSMIMGDNDWLLYNLRGEAFSIRSDRRQGKHIRKTPTTGTKIRELRIKGGLTKAEAAERSGLTLSDMHWIEADVLKPDLFQLNKLSQALNASFYVLLHISLLDNSEPISKEIDSTLGKALEDAEYELYETEKKYNKLKDIVEDLRQQIAEESRESKMKGDADGETEYDS